MIQRETEGIRASMDELVRAKVVQKKKGRNVLFLGGGVLHDSCEMNVFGKCSFLRQQFVSEKLFPSIPSKTLNTNERTDEATASILKCQAENEKLKEKGKIIFVFLEFFIFFGDDVDEKMMMRMQTDELKNAHDHLMTEKVQHELTLEHDLTLLLT